MMLLEIIRNLKDMRFSKLTFLSIFFLVALITFFYFNNFDSSPRVCFGEDCFFVEIVDDYSERALGLMNRKYLGPDSGMLFVFENVGNYPFWMKNTLIPLDMIWLNDEKKIVDIFENAQPCHSDPCPLIHHDGSALFVVELNAGTVSEKNIQVGQTARFEIG